MNLYWKLSLIAALLVIYGGTVWRVKGAFDQAAQEAAIEAQIQEAAKKQAAVEAVAKATEADLLTERQKTAMLTKKLGAAHASKTHTNCKLDPAVIGVLKDATSPTHIVSR